MRQRMIKTKIAAAMVPLLILGACSQSGDGQDSTASIDAAEAYSDTAMEAEAAADAVARADNEVASPVPDLDALQVSLPKLAYVYDFSWAMPGEDIGKLQRRHADLCEQQGPASCQIMGMSKSGEEGDETGELQLAVATRHARAFGALLEDEAEDSGAEQISANIAAEEMSKAIVDTEARLQARSELRDRLLEVLRTRKGDVSELVAAERSVAQVNEEIDQARSWLKEMQGRVAYSRVNIHYESGTAVGGDFIAPIKGAFDSIGSILGFVIAGLIILGAIVLPVGAVVWLGRLANRRFGTPKAQTEA